MNVNYIKMIRDRVKNTRPLIHCITNPISITQCANGILAQGASPIMAQHPSEVWEITSTAKALVVNIGNITDTRLESIKISAQCAAQNNIPFVLDAVGVSCSELRRKFAENLIANNTPTVIKGNYSEINAIYNQSYSSAGVDADKELTLQNISDVAVKLANQYNTTVLASGKTDIVTDGKMLVYIHNGTPQLATVTGTGCLLGALCGTYLSSAEAVEAAATACSVLGICGQLSQTEKGSGTFLVNLMDNLSSLKADDLEKYIDMEVVTVEKS